MPSRSFSTTVLKKSRAALVGGLVLLAALAARPAAAQTVDLAVSAGRGGVTANVLFHWPRTPELVDSLRKGLESRITFTVRLYQKRRRGFFFSQDRLLAERVVVRSVFWDYLDGVFVVEQDGARPTTYTDPDLLIDGFFGLQQVLPYPATELDLRRASVSARAQFEPVRLMPPLTLVGLVGAAATVATPWARRSFE